MPDAWRRPSHAPGSMGGAAKPGAKHSVKYAAAARQIARSTDKKGQRYRASKGRRLGRQWTRLRLFWDCQCTMMPTNGDKICGDRGAKGEEGEQTDRRRRACTHLIQDGARHVWQGDGCVVLQAEVCHSKAGEKAPKAAGEVTGRR